MTEAMTTTSGTEERPRCQMASKTDHPCWREATERVNPEWDAPELCTEHYRVIELGHEADELLIALRG
jgi:hypothetical protein